LDGQNGRLVPAERHAQTDQRDSTDKTEPALAAEPTENMEAAEATAPIDKIDPAEPTDKIEPAEPIDKIEPVEPIDKIDPLDPMLSSEPAEWADRSELPMFPMPGFSHNMIVGPSRHHLLYAESLWIWSAASLRAAVGAPAELPRVSRTGCRQAVKLLLDEMLSPVTARKLLARGYNVRAVAGHPERESLSDPDVLALARAQQRAWSANAEEWL